MSQCVGMRFRINSYVQFFSCLIKLHEALRAGLVSNYLRGAIYGSCPQFLKWFTSIG